jgi:ABC-type multidrug transport system fused ATPase/permease subunit
MYLIDISAFGLVGFLLLNNRISYGVAMATLVYIKEFVYPIRYLIMDITRMKSSKGIKDKIERFLDQETEINKPAKCLSNDINFIDVSIQFPDFSLNNFNYTFRRGKKYAIIGESGSGKSTILNLLTKNIEPDSGDIEIDGISIKSIDPSSIIGCIGQSEHVFKTNFRNNATIFGAYSDLSMRNSLEFLDCKKLNGIQDNTDSSTLSGGEKQLLALTQMAITNRNILLLDEPFSALDKKNTLLMEERFFGLDDRTLIVVSHNLSEKNLGYFDEVLHMKNGVLISQSDNVNEVSGNITSLC